MNPYRQYEGSSSGEVNLQSRTETGDPDIYGDISFPNTEAHPQTQLQVKAPPESMVEGDRLLHMCESVYFMLLEQLEWREFLKQDAQAPQV